MSCEKYKSRIADAAAAASVEAAFRPAREITDSELSAHLKTCAACRAEFDAQCALFAEIDRGVAAIVAGEPSGDFAAHVRRRIAEESPASRPWFAGWAPLTAAALALLVFVTFWMIRRAPAPERAKEQAPINNISKPPQGPGAKEQASSVPESTSTAQQKIRPPKGWQMAQNRPLQRAEGIGGRPPYGGRMAPAREPEVLVPRGETQAIARLLNANWSGKANGASLISQPPSVSDTLKPMTIEELRIPALEATPAETGEPPKGSPERRSETCNTNSNLNGGFCP